MALTLVLNYIPFLGSFHLFDSNFWDQAKYLWHALNLRTECFLLVLVSWFGDFSLVLGLGAKCLFPWLWFHFQSVFLFLALILVPGCLGLC